MSDNRDWLVGLAFGLITGVGITVAAYESEKESSGKQELRKELRQEIEQIKRELIKLNDKAEG